MSQTAQQRWGLEEIAHVLVDDDDYVVYSDGAYRHAVDGADWCADVSDYPSEDGYSFWCGDHPAVSDTSVAAKIAAAASLEGIHLGGTCGWVAAEAEDEEEEA